MLRNAFGDLALDESVLAVLAALAGVQEATSRIVRFAPIEASSMGGNVLVDAVSGRIAVVGYVIVADGFVAAKFTDGVGGPDLSGPMGLAANGGVSARGDVLVPLLRGSADTDLALDLSAPLGVNGHLAYYEA